MPEIEFTDLRSSLMISIGAGVVALLDGALITLGIMCIRLLSGKDRTSFTQFKCLQAYVTILMAVNLGYGILEFAWGHIPFIYTLNPNQNNRAVASALTYLANLVPVFLICLTDGLLVWRCYMVHRVLDINPKSSKLRSVAWVFPLCLWVTTMVTGFLGTSFLSARSGRIPPEATALEGAALASNALLNVFATVYISTRLLHHRRVVIACLGNDARTARHLHITAILLESAAINVPTTIVAAIGIASNLRFGSAVTPIAATCQSLASVLIIHQVALGRAIDEQMRSGDGGFTERGPVTMTNDLRSQATTV